MSKLSDIAFEKLRVGDHVISAIGTNGRITHLREDMFYKKSDEDRYSVSIDWDNGNKSTVKHYECDKITYINNS